MSAVPAVAPATAVVVSYNVAGLLKRCLDSVYGAFAAAHLPAHIVVVDNASTDDSVATVRSRFPEALIVENTTNVGFGAACNQGLAAAGDAILFLNSDTELAPDALDRLLVRLRDTPRAALVGPALRFPDGRPQPSRRRFPTPLVLALESTPVDWRLPRLRPLRRFRCEGAREGAAPVDWVSGACLLGRSAALRDVGGFDPQFFMYFEEVDLSRRLAARGWQTWYEPSAVVWHHHSQSAIQDLSARDNYYYTSKHAYAARYFGPSTARVIAALGAALFGVEAGIQSFRRSPALARRNAGLARWHLRCALA